MKRVWEAKRSKILIGNWQGLANEPDLGKLEISLILIGTKWQTLVVSFLFYTCFWGEEGLRLR